MEIRLISPSGQEDIVEIEADLWERFEALAKERDVLVEELFKIAVDTYLRDKGV